MINRKLAALLVCAAFLLAAGLYGQVSAGVRQQEGGPGTASDPLVSRSYVDEQVDRLQQQFDRLQKDVSFLKEELAGLQPSGPGGEQGTVGLTKGKKGAVAAQSGAVLRSGPGKEFEKVGGLKKGAVVEILEVQEGWCRVKTDSGETGWVSGELLQTTE